MAKQKGQPKIRSPFNECGLIRQNLFVIEFPKELGINSREVQSADFHHDNVTIVFKCSNKTRTLQTLRELSDEKAAIDFRVQVVDLNGVVCQELLFNQYVVIDTSFGFNYEFDRDVEITVQLMAASQYIQYEGIHYTFDRGVWFDQIIEKKLRNEVLKRIQERMFGGSNCPIEEKDLFAPPKFGNTYTLSVHYDNPCQKYISDLFAKFIDDDNRDVFAYRKSRQVGSTRFLHDIAKFYLTYGKKVLVISDQGGLTQFKDIKNDCFRTSTTLKHVSERYDLVILTENLMYRNQYKEGDVEALITPQLLKGGKIVIELPAYVHDFYDCDDNYMPWWLDDKKVGAENGNIELWVDNQIHKIILDKDELIRVYKKNINQFKEHKAFYRNRWSEQMNDRLCTETYRFPYGERWWDEMGE